MERSLSNEVLYGRPPDHLRIFVSSKMRGGSLAAERAAARDAVDAYPKHKAWLWERDTAAGPYSSVAACLGKAATSDGLILIVGEDLTPITRREYFAALREGVPPYVFVKDGLARTTKAQRFIRAQQNKKVVTANFANTRELKTQIRAALGGYQIYAIRLANLNRRPQP